MGICQKIEELLSSYIDDALSSEELAEVEEHLGCCEACKKELACLQELTARLKNLPKPEFPTGLHESFMARIKAEAAKRKPRSVLPLRAYGAMAAGMLLMLTTVSLIAVMLQSTQKQSRAGATLQETALYSEEAAAGHVFLAEPVIEYDSANTVTNDTGLILVSGNEGKEAKTDELMVRTYNIELQTEDFEESLKIIDSLPGYNASSEIVDRSREKWAWISRRIDDGSYETVKTILNSVGKPVRVDESFERITSEKMDLEVRLAEKQEEIKRLTSLLESSRTMNVLTMVESRLGQVENELDGLKGQLSLYINQCAMPYIHISLRPVPDAVAAERESLPDRARKAFAASVNGTLRVMEDFLVILSFISVPAVLIGLFLLCFWLIRKNLQKRRLTDEKEG